MLIKPKHTNAEGLSLAIDTIIAKLLKTDAASEEYAAAVDQMQKLHKMKDAESAPSVTPDILILAATNIAGIIMIIKHEQLNVITSKALGFVLKPKA